MKNGPAELNSLKRECGRSGWLSVAGDEISCGGEKVRRRDWEKGVKSEEKRRVFFWVVRWAYPALTNQAVYLDWIGDGEIVGVAVWW